MAADCLQPRFSVQNMQESGGLFSCFGPESLYNGTGPDCQPVSGRISQTKILSRNFFLPKCISYPNIFWRYIIMGLKTGLGIFATLIAGLSAILSPAASQPARAEVAEEQVQIPGDGVRGAV